MDLLWWIPDEPLEEGETEIFSVLANHSLSAWRAVGGKLIATDQRLLFRPNVFDQLLGGRIWSVPIGSIVLVGRKRPTGGLFNGGLRTRLRIDTDDGRTHLFVVVGLRRVIQELTQLAP